ncbi:MAG: T9SS type A sorting domain-containing protein [Lewinellaceae bacterium]|nr:T9SS type A sorting domain-containing protein [Lewinellaceae bacterium]
MSTPNLTAVTPAKSFKWLLVAAQIAFLAPFSNAATVTCPEDVTIQLGVDACGIIVNLNSLEFETTVPLVDTVFFPASNSVFPIGNTQVTMLTANVNGEVQACVFHIIVLDYVGPEVVCKPSISLSLNGNCERMVTASNVLLLGFNGCPSNFALFRVGPGGTLGPPYITAYDIGSQVTIRTVQPLTGEFCETSVTVFGGTPPSFTCPPDVTIVCNLPADSAFTGVPILDGCYENLQLSYTDELTPADCPDSFAYQIIRLWKGTDPYGNMEFCEQIITAEKFDVNLVTFPPNRDGVEAPALVCSDTLDWEMVADPEESGFPVFNGFPPNLSPHCKISVNYTDFETNICGESWEIKRVWKVVRTCTPFITLLDTQIIKILDPNPPVFSLPDTIYFSVLPDCADSLLLPAANILSECSAYSVLIETPWDTFYTNSGILYLDSVPQGAYPLHYAITDACFNTASKNPILLIENGTFVKCPPDTTFNCDYYNDTINIALQLGNTAAAQLIGNPTYYANCSFPVSEVDSFYLNSCGVGTVKRFLTNAGAANPVTCAQTITVTPASDFEVLFPEDVAICTTLAAGQTGDPTLFNVSCENVTINHTDSIVLGSLAGCFTAYRTFIVKNTCTFNGDTSLPDPQVDIRRYADGGDGYLEYTQVIEVNNTAGPTFPNGCAINDIYLPDSLCSVPFTVPSPVDIACGGNPTLQVSGDVGNTLGGSLSLPIGNYSVVYTSTDDCGKSQTCTTSFKVLDKSAPKAKCKAPFTIEPMSVLTPIQLNNGSFDNCPFLEFSFSKDSVNQSRVFPCCTNGTYPVTLWVTDASGNQDSCHTFVVVEPDTVVCVCNISLSGTIKTEDGKGVSDVRVVAHSSAGDSDTIFTGPSGGYSFTVLPGLDYSISVDKNDFFLNGVTTFDIVLLSRHILGISSLNSPYKIIAADANRSNTVTTFDAVEIRRLILNITTAFPNNTSWRFIGAGHVFPNPVNPFQTPFPEIINITNPQSNMPTLDFIAMKVGDLNNSVDPLMFAGGASDRENGVPVHVKMPNLVLEKNQEYDLPVLVDQALAGFQFALYFDKNHIQLTGLDPQLGSADNYVCSPAEGLVKTSWSSATAAQNTKGNPVIFTLHFKAKSNGRLEDFTKIDKALMPAEAYDPSLEVHGVELLFESPPDRASQVFQCYPAQPNPFDKSTTVGLYLPDGSDVTCRISDTSGRMVWSSTSIFGEGYHELVINNTDLPGTGVYLLNIETIFGSSSQRLVLSK